MRAPAFWARPPGVLAALLSPAALIWQTVTARRMARAGSHLGVPVICVGNLTAGGTGKTPVVCAVLEALTRHGRAPHALSRGYGGSEAGPLRVDPGTHTAAQVGDEPLLLSAFAPTWIARDRAAGARTAAGAGADAIVLDDGFQNPALHKDLSLLVIDAEAGFGNGRVIPAGPLREPVAAGLARADLCVLLGPDAARTAFRAGHPEVTQHPLIEGTLRPLLTGMPWEGLRCFAFAGIGRPAKFFATLRATGAEVVGTQSFADHAPYPRPVLQRLLSDAAKLGAQLVTTEKDAVRLPPDLRREVLTLPVRVDFADASPLETLLAGLTPDDR
ncbi:MAG: tetraacyldisaccharide 4'-kinase [Pseudomonadota bacterium]